MELFIGHCGLNDAGFRAIQESVTSNVQSRLHYLDTSGAFNLTSASAVVLEKFATTGRRNVCRINLRSVDTTNLNAAYNAYITSDWVQRIPRIYVANPSFYYEHHFGFRTDEFDYVHEASVMVEFYRDMVKNIQQLRNMFCKMKCAKDVGNVYIKPTLKEVYSFPYTIGSFARFLAGGYARLRYELFKNGACSWEEAEVLVNRISDIMPHIFYRDVFLYGLPETEKRRQFVVYMNESQILEKAALKLAMPVIAGQFFSDNSVQKVAELVVYRQNLEKASMNTDGAKAAIASMTNEQVTEGHDKLVKLEQRNAKIEMYKSYAVLTLKVLAATAMVYCVIRSSKINFRELLTTLQPSKVFER